jgi:hypothetical protein
VTHAARRPVKYEFFPQAAREYGSQIITALEQAWAAIRDQHPEIPDVVIVTGQEATRKGCRRATACAVTTGPSGG